ncbi:MAG: hypothetical protein IKF97_06940 [Clostridia bacterium]|nr:hypothetical protein [Clostridia bacterium]
MNTNLSLDEIRKKVKRIEKPFLKQLPYKWIDDIPYENYDGVNVNLEMKEGGDVIRIRQLKKVGKDGSGTYLYWGYIYNTSDEENEEIKDLDKEAYPVCFESFKKLADIAKDKDMDEIESLLMFLSYESNFKRSNTVNYIGHLVAEKKETKKEIITEYRAIKNQRSKSPAIQKQIEKIQRDYIQNSLNTDDRKDEEDAR